MAWHGYTVNDAELACTLNVSIMLYRTHETKKFKFRTKMRSADGQSREGEGREGEKPLTMSLTRSTSLAFPDL